jgi:hypothetical protein
VATVLAGAERWPKQRRTRDPLPAHLVPVRSGHFKPPWEGDLPLFWGLPRSLQSTLSWGGGPGLPTKRTVNVGRCGQARGASARAACDRDGRSMTDPIGFRRRIALRRQCLAASRTHELLFAEGPCQHLSVGALSLRAAVKSGLFR